jgi:hypothetical protein
MAFPVLVPEPVYASVKTHTVSLQHVRRSVCNRSTDTWDLVQSKKYLFAYAFVWGSWNDAVSVSLCSVEWLDDTEKLTGRNVEGRGRGLI